MGPSGTYSPYPGIALEGNSKLYVQLKGAVDGFLKLDTHGLGIREGTSAAINCCVAEPRTHQSGPLR